jgi:LacI family transcriptional regulator
MRPDRPTQKDVAAAAGVSTAVVSLVLNGRNDGRIRISDETRERVWEAIRNLGYVADPAARRLAGGQNRLLGVFTYEPLFPLESHDFYYPFLIGIEAEAERQGYDLLLFTRNSGDGTRSVFEGGVNRLRLADGAVLLGRVAATQELVSLRAARYPFVFVGRRQVPGKQVSYVAAGYADATAEIVRHLAALGHRRIAYLRVPSEAESSTDREQGYREAHEKLAIPLDERLIVRCESVAPGFLGELIAAGATAVVAENQALASDVLAGCRALALRVPTDLSVAALGDSARAASTDPELTSFRIPREAMGAQAVRMLVEQLAGGAPSGQKVLPCTFWPGRTTGPAPTPTALAARATVG